MGSREGADAAPVEHEVQSLRRAWLRPTSSSARHLDFIYSPDPKNDRPTIYSIFICVPKHSFIRALYIMCKNNFSESNY